MLERCELCRYWKPSENDDVTDYDPPEYRSGQCRRHAPTLNQATLLMFWWKHNQAMPGTEPTLRHGAVGCGNAITSECVDFWKHPATRSSDWCGDFEAGKP